MFPKFESEQFKETRRAQQRSGSPETAQTESFATIANC